MSKLDKNEVFPLLGDGPFLIGEFRAGYAGIRAWVDKEDGKCKSMIEAHILVEMAGSKGAQSVKLYLNPPSTVSDPAQIVIPWEKGQRYVFPIRTLKSDKGSLSGGLDDRREVIPL